MTTNPEQYSLNIGELQYIKVQAHYSDQTVKDVTDNAEFVTSDAKVAAVSRGGKVEALGEGEAVITVRYGGKTAQVAVSVSKRGLELAPPVWVDALLIGNHHMFLIWYGVPGATAYNIYRAESEDGVYTKIATLADTIYLDSSLRAGTTSRYKVTAVLESEPSDSISAATASPQR